MWQQAAKDQTDGAVGKEDKQQVDSQTDSGFLSGSNLISSELSLDMENEEQKDDPKVAPEPAKAIDSGLDLGLTDGLSHLSLKEETLNILDSGTFEPDAKDLISDVVENDKPREPWEIYYTQDEDGDTQLHGAIVQGYLEATFFLISLAPHPCLLNILNDEFLSPLHLAVLTHQPMVVRRLILSGADPTIKNYQGNTPLHLACSAGNVSCAQALTNPFTLAERSRLDPGKRLPPLPQNLELRNYEGETCLHVAAAKGHMEAVRHLLRLGADLEARDGLSGRTPLHVAIEHRQLDLVNFLVRECRAQLEATTYARLTAYQLASYIDEKLAKELVRLGAKPSLPPGFEDDSDEDDDDDEEDDEQNSVAMHMMLTRLGVATKSVPTVVTV